MAKNNNSKPVKGKAYTQPDHIKSKSKWTKGMTKALIAIVVIVCFILALIGINQGWFKSADMVNGKAEVSDYSTIEVQSADVEVTEEAVDSYIASVASSFTTTETVTEGTVEDGDTVNINYSGVLEGEEEPFEGGTAENQSLTLGSGSMIEGFESSIVGHEIGETFDINVTFPENYDSEDLAGKNATFTITINSKTITTEYELTDEMVQEYSAENLDEQINTVDELKEYYRTHSYESKFQSAVLKAMTDKTKVIYYNEADLATLKTYYASTLTAYANYGIDSNTMAQMYGFDSADAYAESNAKSTLTETMMLDKVAQDKGITVSDEEINAKLEEYMKYYSFEGTVEEFKLSVDAGFLFMIEKTDVLGSKVVDALKDNVVIVETPVEETTEAAADEETTAAEAVEETTAAEAVEETTAAETVEETTVAETVEETTVAETVEETTVAETVEETTVAETIEETTAAK